MSQLLDDLTSLGLSDKEARSYVQLLQLGESTVQKLALASGIKRPTTYLMLGSLMEKGIVTSYTKGKKTYYIAEHPRQVRTLLAKKKEELDHLGELAESLVPQLEALYSLAAEHPVVKYYEGAQGQIAMRQEASNDTTLDIYSFVALDELLEAFPHYTETHEHERVKQGRRSHVIYTHREGPQVNDNPEYRESRFVPRDRYPFRGSVSVHPVDGKVYISFYKGSYAGVVIESKPIADMFLAIWHLSWAAAEIVKKD